MRWTAYTWSAWFASKKKKKKEAKLVGYSNNRILTIRRIYIYIYERVTRAVHITKCHGRVADGVSRTRVTSTFLSTYFHARWTWTKTARGRESRETRDSGQPEVTGATRDREPRRMPLSFYFQDLNQKR